MFPNCTFLFIRLVRLSFIFTVVLSLCYLHFLFSLLICFSSVPSFHTFFTFRSSCIQNGSGIPVSIVTGLWNERPGLDFRHRIFLCFSTSKRALGPNQPPIQRVPAAHSPKVKRPEVEAGHSLPASSEIRLCVAIHQLSHTSS
jgi:hypothetical protein